MVLIEAFLRKTPAIVRDLGALPEIVQESGGGSVYRNDTELVQRMNDLLQDSSQRHTLGQRGYQAYKRNWTAEAHLERYLGLIRRIGADRGYPID